MTSILATRSSSAAYLATREGGTLEGLTIGSVWKEWHVASLSGVEWWKRINTETVDFLVHSSLGNIWLLVVMVLLLREGGRSLEGLTIGSVLKEWHGASLSGVEWWKRINTETVDFLVHSSLSDIWLLVVLLVVLSLREGSTFESLCIRTVRNEWVSALNFNVEWWESFSNETVDFFVHSSLSNIWSLVVLSVVLSLT
jgi:hypothetical protein